ncbi:MAG TPA: hypothetical protein VJT31_28450 [Rugosimonospora sp.]|nr:hypothetical protein [Rugosimonospora sp.]
MTRPNHHRGRPHDRRTRIALAMITGLISGATRAILDALLHHLTTGC